jgi:CRP/FNR family transcriptional regulator, cyclic AMP receptor protein
VQTSNCKKSCNLPLISVTVPKRGVLVSDENELLTRMSANSWFNTLETQDQRTLISGSEALRLRTGEFVFRHGDGPGGIYGLVNGSLKVSTLREDGREAILAVLEAGNWFGEASAIDGLPRSHDVAAVGPAELLRVEPRVFDELMLRASFARAIAMLQAMHIRAAYASLEDARLRPTRAQIARRLVRLARGDVSLEPTERHTITVTHDTLAMMVGVTRQTLALELKAMANEGAVALGYGRIDIVSMDKLTAIAREESG